MANLSDDIIIITDASTTAAGVVSVASQSFAGLKSFTYGVAMPNSIAADVTVTTGNGILYPFLTVDVGRTVTIDAGAEAVILGDLVVDGTYIDNGTTLNIQS